MKNEPSRPNRPGATVKTTGQPLPGSANRVQPCATCRWRVWNGSTHRCHANPPQIRIPYENLAAWPVVPETGGGCRLHEPS